MVAAAAAAAVALAAVIHAAAAAAAAAAGLVRCCRSCSCRSRSSGRSERLQEQIEKALDALLVAWQERGEEAAPKAWVCFALLALWTLAEGLVCSALAFRLRERRAWDSHGMKLECGGVDFTVFVSLLSCVSDCRMP